MQRFFVDENGSYLGSYDGQNHDLPHEMAGRVEVPNAPQDARQKWDGEKWLEVAPTAEMLTAELERRLSLGFDFDFGDARGVHHFGTTSKDMERWIQEVTPLAQAAMNRGEPSRLIGIKTDTGPVSVKASEWWAVLDAAASWRQPIYAAYFALKEETPIPDDYASGISYWPRGA